MKISKSLLFVQRRNSLMQRSVSILFVTLFCYSIESHVQAQNIVSQPVPEEYEHDSVESCQRLVPTCVPRFEEKKVKTSKYSLECECQCDPGREPWHGHACDPLHHTTCKNIVVRKKLMKHEEEEVEKVLKYDLVWVPSETCEEKPCRNQHFQWNWAGFCDILSRTKFHAQK